MTTVKPKILLEKDQFDVTLKRLCHQLIEVHNNFENSVLIGLQPRGIFLANRIKQELEKILKLKNIRCGALDITFFRDDFRKKELIPNKTNIDFIFNQFNRWKFFFNDFNASIIGCIINYNYFF